MQIYRLRVSLLCVPHLYRIIEAPGNCTFAALHEVIFAAFDRDEHHLYSFYLTGKDSRSIENIYDAPEIADPLSVAEDPWGTPKRSAAETRLGKVGLGAKDVFHYLFDFGDCWWHRIRIEGVKPVGTTACQPRLVKSVGESPPQYALWDEDDYNG